MINPDADAKKVLAPCGIYCVECSFQVAYETKEREHIKAMPEKFDKFKEMEMDQFHCEGCTPENTFADCKIKQCAMARKLENCGQCGEFPCVLIDNFANDGIPHHKKAKENLEYIKKSGMEKFIEEKERQIRCDCGEKLSWYVTKCLVCGRTKE